MANHRPTVTVNLMFGGMLIGCLLGQQHRRLDLTLRRVIGSSADLVSHHDGRPTVAAVNSTVTFVCHSHDPAARWEHFAVGSTQPVDVYNGIKVSPAYIRTHTVAFSYNTGDSVLTVSRIRAADSGKYRCFKPSVSAADEFELTVYDSSPICSSSAPFHSFREDEHNIFVNCEVVYIGNSKPCFECVAYDEGATDFASMRPVRATCAGNETVSASEEQCTKFSAANVKLSGAKTFGLAKCTQQLCVDRSLHGKRLSCAAYFEAANGSRSRGLTTRNSWKNDTLNVLYGPSSVSLSVSNGTLQLVGVSVLSCSADSNPAPVYTWTHVTTARRQPESHNGSTLAFDICKTPQKTTLNHAKDSEPDRSQENPNTVYVEAVLQCTATAGNRSAARQITVSGLCEMEQQPTSGPAAILQPLVVDHVTEKVAAAVEDGQSTPTHVTNTDNVRLALIVFACVLTVALIGCGVVIAMLLRKKKSRKRKSVVQFKVDTDTFDQGREVGSYIDPFQHEYVEITDLQLPPAPTDVYSDTQSQPQLPTSRGVYEEVGVDQPAPAVYTKLSSSSTPGDD